MLNTKTIKDRYEVPVFTKEIEDKLSAIYSEKKCYVEAETKLINKQYVSIITMYLMVWVSYYNDHTKDGYENKTLRIFISKDDVVFQTDHDSYSGKNNYTGKREPYFISSYNLKVAYIFKDEKTKKVIDKVANKYKVDHFDIITKLSSSTYRLKMEQSKKRMLKNKRKKQAEMKENFKDFSNRIPSKLKKEAISKLPVYFFEKVTDDKKKLLYCTSCNKEVEIEKFDKHLSKRTCPCCKKKGKVERVTVCKENIHDHNYIIWPELKDDKINIRCFITERQIYKDNYKVSELETREVDREVIKNGKRYLYENRWGNGWHSVSVSNSNFNERSGMYNWYLNNYYCGYGYIYSKAKSFIEDDAKYEYLCKKWYKEGCEINTAVEDWWLTIIEDVHLYKKADTIEKLDKVGLYYLTKDCYYLSDFNYKASKLKDILKLTNAAYKIFTKKKNSIYDLRILQGICKKSNFDVDYYTKLLDINSLSFYDELYGKKKIINYLLKQKTKNHTVTYSEYKHYLNTIEELGYDMKLKIHLYPRDFMKTDKRVTEELVTLRKEIDRNKKLSAIERVKETFDPDDPRNACIKRISDGLRKMKDLNKFMQGSEGLVVKVPETYADLKIEGISLDNCIGSYIDKIANGDTFIFFIRKVEDVDKPFYAMEYNKGQIRQIHGFANCNPTAIIEDFCKKFAVLLQNNMFDPKKLVNAA